ncbi:MAG: nucleotide exchange factor GrpE [Pyrinomonadaceae bacterium]
MNSKKQIPKPEESLDEVVGDAMSSVDDFIRELEAKEKDLHITSDLEIEIEESEPEEDPVAELVVADAADIDELRKPAQASVGKAPTMPKSGRPGEPGLKTRVYELETELETLNERIRQLKAERNDIQEKSDRRLKDFESFKYRMDRERRGAFIDQLANLAGAMLPVLDNVDRALVSVDRGKVDSMPEFSKFYDGIALVHQQVNEVLGEMGVEPIKSIGEHFDPQFHEAVATEQREDMPNNSISEEMLRGYRIGNRVVRHSMVKVTQGGPTSSIPDPQDPAVDPPSDAAPSTAETAIEPVE